MELVIGIVVFAIILFTLDFLGLPIRFNLSFRPIFHSHETSLKDVQNRIGIFGFLRFLPFQRGGHCSLRHKLLLSFVCAYTFLFFNPQTALSTAKPQKDVYCPNNYAYGVAGGHYIKCEDFDEFHLDLFHGKTRTDLYIK